MTDYKITCNIDGSPTDHTGTNMNTVIADAKSAVDASGLTAEQKVEAKAMIDKVIDDVVNG